MLQESFIRLQLSLFKPFVSNCSLKTAREGQDKLGLLMASMQKKQVTVKDISLCSFNGAMISPKVEQSGGVIPVSYTHLICSSFSQASSISRSTLKRTRSLLSLIHI